MYLTFNISMCMNYIKIANSVMNNIALHQFCFYLFNGFKQTTEDYKFGLIDIYKQKSIEANICNVLKIKNFLCYLLVILSHICNSYLYQHDSFE